MKASAIEMCRPYLCHDAILYRHRLSKATFRSAAMQVFSTSSITGATGVD